MSEAADEPGEERLEAMFREELAEVFAVSLRDSLNDRFEEWMRLCGGKPGATDGFTKGFGQFVAQVLGYIAVISTSEAEYAAWREAWWAAVQAQVEYGLPDARARLAWARQLLGRERRGG